MQLDTLLIDAFSTLPLEMLPLIVEKDLTIKDIYHLKHVSTWFNNNIDYWMINSTIIKNENSHVCTNGLISFNFNHQTKNFQHFMHNESHKRAKALTLLGWDNTIPQALTDFSTILSSPIACTMVSKLYPNMVDSNGNTLMHIACNNNANVLLGNLSDRIETINFLLENYANPNIQNKKGQTPFMRACHDNQIKIVKMLLKNGADPNTKDAWGNTLLEKACDSENIPIIQCLLQSKKTDLTTANSEGYTLLHRLCLQGKTDLVKLLLENTKCSSTNIKDKIGWLPIHSACRLGYKEIIELLLTANPANGTVKTTSGYTPTYLANLHKYPQIVKLLDSHNQKHNTDLPMLIEPKMKKYYYRLTLLLLILTATYLYAHLKLHKTSPI